MKNIAKNLISGKNLEKTYNKLADLLNMKKLFAEQCYTYESICRLLDDDKKLEKYNKKIMAINLSSCKSSYDKYIMSNTPIENEFPVQKTNKSTDILLSYVDRYLAIIHLLMIVYDFNDILKISSDSLVIKDKITFMLPFSDNELSKHIKRAIEGEEYRLAELLGNDIFCHIDVLKLAVKYGCEKEEIYLKIICYHYSRKEFEEAIRFYNEAYALVFNLPLVKSLDELSVILADKNNSLK